MTTPPTTAGAIAAGPALAVTPGLAPEWRSLEEDALRAILGARETEPLADAARRVVADLEDVRARAERAHREYSRTEQTHGAITGALRINVLATRAEILAAIDRLTYDRDLAQRAMVRAQAVAEHERQRGDVIDRERATVRAALDLARDEAERLTRERDEAKALMDGALDEQARLEQRAWTAERERDAARVHEPAHEVAALRAERDAALERCGYYERGHTARLLGIAPDQLDAVRAVLRAAAPGATLPLDSVRAHRLEMAARGWVAAGRPLAGEEEVRGG